MTFNIVFCQDNGSGIPDYQNPVSSYTITASHDSLPVCILDGLYYFWDWHVDLDPECNLINGWIGINGQGNGDTCCFLWGTSQTGYGYNAWHWNGENGSYVDAHFAFCLTGDENFECLDCSAVCWTPRVPQEGGTIIWDLTVNNCGTLDVYPVIGEIVPTNTDCNGTQYDFNLTREIVSSLSPGASYSRPYFYNPVGVAPSFMEVAVNIYVGEAVNDYLGNCCFEFTFATGWGRGGNAENWGAGGEWGDYDSGILPNSSSLDHNYPNPFNSNTTIPFTLISPSHVNLSIYNISGQLVETLYNGRMVAGFHSLMWEASAVASGVYFYKLTVDNISTTKRMELIK
jgi:hypothetical protein